MKHNTKKKLKDETILSSLTKNQGDGDTVFLSQLPLKSLCQNLKQAGLIIGLPLHLSTYQVIKYKLV